MHGFGKLLLERLIERLGIETEVANSLFKGCSQDDIDRIRIAQVVNRLPVVYQDFLMLMGKDAGPLFQGSDYSCEKLVRMKQGVIDEFHDETPPLSLPIDAFVFYNHHDYQILYFLTDNDNDDPPVNSYVAGKGSSTVYLHLSDFYLGMIERFR